MNNSSCWITWEIQPRNRSMSAAIGVPLYELLSNKPRIIRYLELSIKTLMIVSKKDIKIIYVQNPSIVLSFLAAIIKIFTSKIVVVDAHNAGIHPAEGKSYALKRIVAFICRTVDLTIVTNEELAKDVRTMGGTPFVLPDPIPSYEPSFFESDPAPYFLFICTWADDEPYKEVLEAAKNLESELNIFITGNFRKKLSAADLSEIPRNINLLGFVSEQDYLKYLSNALATIDLTTRENCLVCGAYESLALSKPGILSDTTCARETFPSGFVFTLNNSQDIARSIDYLYHNLHKYSQGAQECREYRRLSTQERVKDLRKYFERYR